MISLRSRSPFAPSRLDKTLLVIVISGLCAGTLTACRESTSASNTAKSPAETSDSDPSLSSPPPPPSSAFLALLTPEQTARIKALGVPLVVPTAIPSEFVVEQVDVTSSDRFTGYQILYRDGDDRCFLIEYTSGGIGGIPKTANRLPLNLPILGQTTGYGLNYGHYVDPHLRAQFPQPELMSDWLPIDSGFYRLVGAAYTNNVLSPPQPCQDITPDVAVAILESSALITDEIQGDDSLPD